MRHPTKTLRSAPRFRGDPATPPVALTIAGSDSGGGAGIQADLKTFAALGVFGTSAITAVTAQNTRRVVGFIALASGFVDEQIGAVLSDLPVRATKTGMLASTEIVGVVTERAAAGDLPNLVVDPVLVASSGDKLALGGVAEAYPKLFGYATVITPNLREAGLLLGRELSTVDDMVAAAEELAETGAGAVVIKGGHLHGELDAGGRPQAVDVLWHAGAAELLRGPWIDTPNTHGTGCSFASAVTAGLARGVALPEAVAAAKTYVNQALAGAARWRLGGGHGPLDHFLWEAE
ncbi:MAG: bifunctional hydroxymethylpyrimidine kinase/phosphomethylpyrimidine kinase [Micromonosporaceae bacterium]